MANALFYRIKVTAIEELIYSLSNQSYSKKSCGYKRIEETN